MCSTVSLIFKNNIYITYRDLNTLIILNNVLKVTLDIVENVFIFRTSSCARINYECIYNLRIVGSETFHGKPSLENLIKASWNWFVRNNVMMTPTHRFFPLPNPAKLVLTWKTWGPMFSIGKEGIFILLSKIYCVLI